MIAFFGPRSSKKIIIHDTINCLRINRINTKASDLKKQVGGSPQKYQINQLFMRNGCGSPHDDVADVAVSVWTG